MCYFPQFALMHEPFCADTMFLCSYSNNDSLSAEGSDGCGEGKACPGVKDVPQDGLSILIPCKLFCLKEMTFHYLNLDTYLIIFSHNYCHCHLVQLSWTQRTVD